MNLFIKTINSKLDYRIAHQVNYGKQNNQKF